MRCKQCHGTNVQLDRIIPTRSGHAFHRYRCQDCGHYRSKHVIEREPRQRVQSQQEA